MQKRTQWQRNWVVLDLLGLAGGLALLYPWARWAVPGLLRREHFWRGLPTSYWRDAILQWSHSEDRGLYGPTPAQAILERWGFPCRRHTPAIVYYNGRPGAKALVLADLLADPDAWVWGSAANDLLLLGQDAVPALLGALEHPDRQARCEAADILGRMRPVATAAVPALLRGARGEGPLDASAAARALQDIGLPAVPGLARLLVECAEAQARRRAVGVLEGILGEQNGRADEVVEALAPALADADRSVRVAAALAVGCVARPPPPLPRLREALLEALQDPDRLSRFYAASALGRLAYHGPPHGEPAARALRVALDDGDERVR